MTRYEAVTERICTMTKQINKSRPTRLFQLSVSKYKKNIGISIAMDDCETQTKLH
jgi:hypothetical protein